MNWIEEQCQDTKDSMKKNNSKKTYQLVKDLTSTKQGRTTTIQDKDGKCLTEEQDILKRGSEYCSELYHRRPISTKRPSSNRQRQLPHPSRRCGSSGEIAQEGEVSRSGQRPSGAGAGRGRSHGKRPTDYLPWTQSLIITLPKKGNRQLCQNYRTMSFISHPSKVMLKILLNRLKPQAEKIIAEEQADFRPGRSTTEQICNLRILCEKYLQHQQDLYHVFVDFKKAFDRVLHAALWATMRQYNINTNLIRMIQNLYDKATSAVYLNNSIGDWFRTTVGVRQGCVLSPTIFNIFLERIMTDALNDHEGTVSIGGRKITNLRFADHIDGLAGREDELADLVELSFGMQINAEKTKLMTNNTNGISTDIMGQRRETRFASTASNTWEQSSQMKDLNLKFSPVSPRPQQHSKNSRPSGMTGM